MLCASSEQAGFVWCAQSCHPAACEQKSLLIWDLGFASTAAHPFCLGCSLPVSSSAAAVANTGLVSLGIRQRIKANIPRNFLLRIFLERQHMTLLTLNVSSAGASEVLAESIQEVMEAPFTIPVQSYREQLYLCLICTQTESFFWAVLLILAVPRPPSNVRWGVTEHGTVQKGSFSHYFIWKLSISCQL